MEKYKYFKEQKAKKTKYFKKLLTNLKNRYIIYESEKRKGESHMKYIFGLMSYRFYYCHQCGFSAPAERH